MQPKSKIFVTSHGDIFIFFVKMDNMGKELIYGKKNGGHRTSEKVNCSDASTAGANPYTSYIAFFVRRLDA